MLEEPDFQWWLGIYEELVHTRPPVDPRLLMPLAPAEPNKGEGTDTSEQRTSGTSGQANGGAGDA